MGLVPFKKKQKIQRIWASETTLYDTMADACHYTHVQTHRLYDTKSEPKCKLWTLADNDALTQVQLLKRVELLCRSVDNDGGYVCVKAGDIKKNKISTFL